MPPETRSPQPQTPQARTSAGRNARRLAGLCTAIATAITVALGAAACGESPAVKTADGRIDVVAAFYPLQLLAERVGGDRVSVTNLVKPGAEPHDLELSPQQLAQITGAGLVVYLAGFQPAVDEAVKGQAPKIGFDAAAVQPLLDAPDGTHAGEEKDANAGKDPHIWLDPNRFAAIGDQLAERLGTVDPGNAAAFKNRAAALHAALTSLDGEYQTSLRACQRKEIVTSHAAFGYLADRYGLTQIPISGLTPEDEPTPQRLTEVAKLAKDKGVTTIFFETLVSPKVAETLAKEVGAKAEVLDPIEGLEEGSKEDYFSVMRENLGRLKTALGCS